MKTPRYVLVLSLLIALLAAFAAGIGVLPGEGEPFPFTTLHGETVMIHGRGIYAFDSVSGAAQVSAGDAVTLALGIPLLLVSAWLAGRGSLRGRLLLAGVLGYFLYTYVSIVFLAAYNNLFLVYTALFSLSLFALIGALASFDLAELAARFHRPAARLPVAVFLFLLAGFLLLNWVGNLILPSLLSGQPPVLLESYTTLVIQALDLGLVVPVAILTGVLLLKRNPLGTLLASVVLVKGFMMSAAISAMIVGMLRAGVEVSPVEMAIFPSIGLIGAGLMVWFLGGVAETPANRSSEPAAA